MDKIRLFLLYTFKLILYKDIRQISSELYMFYFEKNI